MADGVLCPSVSPKTSGDDFGEGKGDFWILGAGVGLGDFAGVGAGLDEVVGDGSGVGEGEGVGDGRETVSCVVSMLSEAPE